MFPALVVRPKALRNSALRQEIGVNRGLTKVPCCSTKNSSAPPRVSTLPQSPRRSLEDHTWKSKAWAAKDPFRSQKEYITALMKQQNGSPMRACLFPIGKMRHWGCHEPHPLVLAVIVLRIPPAKLADGV